MGGSVGGGGRMTETCAGCGSGAVALYDSEFERHFCGEQCHRDYSVEHFESIYELWAEANLEEA